MKKICFLIISVLTICVSFSTPQIYAITYDNNESANYVRNIELMFENINDEDKFIQLPDGSFLHGQSIDVDAEDPSIVYAKYNSETNPNAITAQEVKKMMIEELENSKKSNNGYIQPRGAGLPTQTKILTPGSSYVSSYFSGSGWRFGGYYIQASSGSGGTLEWNTYNDGGRVGLPFEAANTLNNPNLPEGYPLEVGKPRNINTKMSLGMGYHKLVYYTYNPSNNPYYMVRLLN